MFDGGMDASSGPDRQTPAGLKPGDCVSLDGALFEVRSEPFLGMTGSSIFDVPKLFWRVRVRPLGGNWHVLAYATWSVDEDVAVYGRST